MAYKTPLVTCAALVVLALLGTLDSRSAYASPDPINYGDQVAIGVTKSDGYTFNCRWFGCRVARVSGPRGTNVTLAHGGDKPQGFYLRPAVARRASTGCIKYNDRVIIAATPQPGNTRNCGWYGCRVAQLKGRTIVLNHGGRNPQGVFLRPPSGSPMHNRCIQNNDPVVIGITRRRGDNRIARVHGRSLIVSAGPEQAFYVHKLPIRINKTAANAQEEAAALSLFYRVQRRRLSHATSTWRVLRDSSPGQCAAACRCAGQASVMQCHNFYYNRDTRECRLTDYKRGSLGNRHVARSPAHDLYWGQAGYVKRGPQGLAPVQYSYCHAPTPKVRPKQRVRFVKTFSMQKTPNEGIKAPGYLKIREVTPARCAVRCICDGLTRCASFDYNRTEQSCELSQQTLQPSDLRTDSRPRPNDYYARDRTSEPWVMRASTHNVERYRQFCAAYGLTPPGLGK